MIHANMRNWPQFEQHYSDSAFLFLRQNLVCFSLFDWRDSDEPEKINILLLSGCCLWTLHDHKTVIRIETGLNLLILFFGVWVFKIWFFGVWVFKVWIFGVWIFAVWVFRLRILGVYKIWLLGVGVSMTPGWHSLFRHDLSTRKWFCPVGRTCYPPPADCSPDTKSTD